MHLILLDHPAHGRHFRHIGQGFEFELEKPVLQGAQLCEVMLATAVHQRILINPTHSCGIWAQRRFGAGGQAALNLAQVLQHPRTRPVQVGAVFKQHVDKAVAEKRIATHGLGARHREHGGGQRVSDLVFDNLRGLPRVRRADNHLHIGQVRQGINRRILHRPDAPRGHKQGRQQHQHPVADSPANQRGNHGWLPVGRFGASGVTSSPLRLASESSRNWPELTTCWPSCNPCRMAVWPSFSGPVRTSTGR